MKGGWLGLFLVLCAATPLLAQEDENAVCLKCHENLVRGKVRHDALDEGCAACHRVEMQEPLPKDPDVSPHTTRLVSEGPALCQECHDVPEYPDDAHPPIEEEGCVLCHNAHTSAFDHLLRDRPYLLCRECHADVLILSYRTLHAPADSSCASCHDVHGSPRERYLKAPSPEMCFECHREVQQEVFSRHPHDPAEEDCLNCHDPHASRDVHLLRAYYPEGPYAYYTPLRYALCWDCHDAEEVFGDNDPFRTALGKSLHRVHVQRKKGRICTLCHSPHGSDQEHLIRRKVPFGETGWILPLEILPSGGGKKQCSTACHEARSYSP